MTGVTRRERKVSAINAQVAAKVLGCPIGAAGFDVTEEGLAKAHHTTAALAVGNNQAQGIGGAGDDVEAGRSASA